MSVGGGVVIPEFVEIFVFVILPTIPPADIVVDDALVEIEELLENSAVTVVFSARSIVVVVVVAVVEETFKKSVVFK